MKKIFSKKEENREEDTQKRKKNKKKLWIITGILCLGIVGSIFLFGGSKEPPIETVTVERKDLFQKLNTTGTVVSQESYHFFSPLSTEIGEIKVKKGEAVKKGSTILNYEPQTLAELKTLTQLNLTAGRSGLEDQLNKNNKNQGLYQEATVNQEVLKQQIKDTQAYIDGLEKKIADKQVELEHHGMLLELSRLEWADEPQSEEYQNLLKLIQQNAYEQKNHKDILGWKDELKVYNKMLEDYKTYETEMKSQESSSDAGRLTNEGKEQAKASAEAEILRQENTLEEITAYEKGVTAPFSGILTSIEAVEGKTVQQGELLFTLESLEEVAVSLLVSKYDLEKLKVGQSAEITVAGKIYKGEVDSIQQMATKNSTGAAVVEAAVKIKNPDENLFLGVEAKVKIDTQEAKAVLTLPSAVINIDTRGSFVYVLKDGVVERRDIVTGLSTELETEVKEGLEEGEEVVSEITPQLTEEESITLEL